MKYPFISTVGIQVNFWTIAYVLLFFIVYLGSRGTMKNLGFDLELSFLPPFILAITLGAGYGFVMGSVYYVFEGRLFRNRPFWQIVVYQLVLSLITLSVLLTITRLRYFEFLEEVFLRDNDIIFTQDGWPFFYGLLGVYTILMSVLIGFINQMNKKFGPGVLIPMFLGRFRNPRETERIFMFLDLKNSTTIAEKLGHLLYSELIRDCFVEINEVVQKYYALIYQYVGDEVVLSWEPDIGLNEGNVLGFFYSIQDHFNLRKDYYQKKYGVLPEFKSGAHIGKVTMVEVGEIKRDLAFHGDTLNVASRIENLCKAHNRRILISETLKKRIKKKEGYSFHSLGEQVLKGRKTHLEVFEVKKLTNTSN